MSKYWNKQKLSFIIIHIGPGLDPFIPEVRLPELIIQLYHNPLKEGHK